MYKRQGLKAQSFEPLSAYKKHRRDSSILQSGNLKWEA